MELIFNSTIVISSTIIVQLESHWFINSIPVWELLLLISFIFLNWFDANSNPILSLRFYTNLFIFMLCTFTLNLFFCIHKLLLFTTRATLNLINSIGFIHDHIYEWSGPRFGRNGSYKINIARKTTNDAFPRVREMVSFPTCRCYCSTWTVHWADRQLKSMV